MPLEVTVPNPNLAAQPKPNALGDIPITQEPPKSLGEPLSSAAEEVRITSSTADADIKAKVTNPVAINKALTSGYTREELANYMSQKAGLELNEAASVINDTVKLKIMQAKEAGYSEDQIRQYMQANKYDEQLVTDALNSSKLVKSWEQTNFNPNKPVAESAMDIADLYKNIYGKYSTQGKLIQGIWDTSKGIEARQEIDQLNVGIMRKLQAEGYESFLNPDDGEVMVKDENGEAQYVDDSFINGVWNSKFEIGAAIAGAAKGAKLGSKVPGGLKLLTTPAGAVIGGAIGAATGKGADLTVNAYQLKEDLTRQLYMQQMKEAGIADVIMGTVGAGVFKAGKVAAKASMKGYNYIVEGQVDAAFKEFTEQLHMSPEKANELIKQLEDVHKGQLVKETRTISNKLSFGLIPKGQKELTQSEKGIVALATTQQLAEGTAAQAVAESPRAANALITTINDRAKSLQKSIAAVSDSNTGNLVRKDLEAYTADVKKYYKSVLDIGVEHAGSVSKATDFKFDIDKLAIDPVMKTIVDSVGDPTMKQRFIAYADRIAMASSDRSFEGLINLRQAVNDFKYSKSGLNPTDVDALNGVLNRIDTQVAKAAKDYIPNHKEWLASFSKAKTEYAKMKQFEENVMYQSIIAERNNEKGIRQALNKWSNDKEVDAETFNAVADRVSPKTRSLMEVSAIENLSNKYTVGKVTEFQAVNFPMLAEELSGLNVKSAEGKALVNAVTDISKIFRNDLELAKVTGYIRMPNASQALSTSIAAKTKYWLVSKAFEVVKSRMPGQTGAQTTLIHKTAELLKDPLKFKTVDDFIAAVPEPSKAEMRSLVKELQAATASSKTGKVDTEWQNMYKSSPSGRLVETDGALGRGIYLFDKVVGAKPDANIIKHEVNLTKMATLDDISRIAGAPVLERDLKTLNETADLYKRLSEAGYEGIKLEGKAMLFPDRTVSVVRSKAKPVTKVLDDENKIKVFHGSSTKISPSNFKPGESGRVFVSLDKEYAKGYATTSEGLNEYTIKGNFISYKDKRFIAFVKEMFNNTLPQKDEIFDGKWETLANAMYDNPTLFDKTPEEVNNFVRKLGYDGIRDGLNISILPDKVSNVLKPIPDKGVKK